MEIRWLGDFDPFAHVVEAAPVNAPPLGRVGEVFRPFTAECQQFRGTGLQSAGSVLQRKIKDIALFRQLLLTFGFAQISVTPSAPFPPEAPTEDSGRPPGRL